MKRVIIVIKMNNKLKALKFRDYRHFGMEEKPGFKWFSQLSKLIQIDFE